MFAKMKKYGWLVALLLGLIAAGGYFSRPAPAPLDPLPVRIGIPLQLPSSLLIIAQQQGLFAAEGLAVELHTYPSGARALTEGLLAGRDDFVSAADVPFVYQSFSHPKLQSIATISLNINNFSILTRRDSGIVRLADLKGKSVAVQPYSATHYFVHGVQEVEGIKANEMKLVYAPIEQLGSGLLAGDYDAISIREPYLQIIAQQLGEQAVVLSEPGSYVQHEMLLTQEDFLRQHPQVAERLLRALYRAEQFLRTQPQAAGQLVGHFIGGAPVVLQGEIEYEVALPQALLFMLDAQAQWMVKDGLLPSKTPLPDFLRHIDTTAFHKVMPERATLIE